MMNIVIRLYKVMMVTSHKILRISYFKYNFVFWNLQEIRLLLCSSNEYDGHNVHR